LELRIQLEVKEAAVENGTISELNTNVCSYYAYI
jgi:hypothetical protein